MQRLQKHLQRPLVRFASCFQLLLLSLYFYMYLYLYLYLDLKNLTATALQGKARCSALNALPGCIAGAWPGTPACLHLYLKLYLYLCSYLYLVWPGTLSGSTQCQWTCSATCASSPSPAWSTSRSTPGRLMAWAPGSSSDGLCLKLESFSGISDVVPCPYCKKTMTRKNLSRHITVKHTELEPSICCHCQKVFKSDWSLKEHERVQHGIARSAPRR